MHIKDFINTAIPTLRLDDSVSRALDLMETNRVVQLPLVKDNELIGMLDEFHLGAFEEEMLLSDVIPLETPYLLSHQHLFEAIGLMNDHIEMLPVLDDDKQFIGVITQQDALKQLSAALGMQENGAILVISVRSRDYSLAEIGRLIESNNCKILSSYLLGQLNDLTNPMKLTLKLNQTDITAVVATLERFGYEVEAAYAHQPLENIEQERYDLLMKYLSI